MCSMYLPPALRGVPVLADKKVLLIDRIQRTREARASLLRKHGVEVHEADSLQAARFLWQPKMYDLILFNVRGHLPGDALEFYEQVRETSRRVRVAFLVGPPVYLSLTWPTEFIATERAPLQWDETIRRFSTAA
jgi:PleD family two-component response regulator